MESFWETDFMDRVRVGLAFDPMTCLRLINVSNVSYFSSSRYNDFYFTYLDIVYIYVIASCAKKI